MVSGGAPAIEATLQQGLPLLAKRHAAGQFWTFTMSNSKTLVGHAQRRFILRAKIREVGTRVVHPRAIVAIPSATGNRCATCDGGVENSGFDQREPLTTPRPPASTRPLRLRARASRRRWRADAHDWRIRSLKLLMSLRAIADPPALRRRVLARRRVNPVCSCLIRAAEGRARIRHATQTRSLDRSNDRRRRR